MTPSPSHQLSGPFSLFRHPLRRLLAFCGFFGQGDRSHYLPSCARSGFGPPLNLTPFLTFFLRFPLNFLNLDPSVPRSSSTRFRSLCVPPVLDSFLPLTAFKANHILVFLETDRTSRRTRLSQLRPAASFFLLFFVLSDLFRFFRPVCTGRLDEPIRYHPVSLAHPS